MTRWRTGNNRRRASRLKEGGLYRLGPARRGDRFVIDDPWAHPDFVPRPIETIQQFRDLYLQLWPIPEEPRA